MILRRSFVTLALALTAPAAAAAEALTTDLPDFLEGACTVGRGAFQIDTNLALTHDRAQGADGRLRATPTLLSLGLTDRLDLRVETDGAVRERVRDASGESVASGRADASIGLKYAFAHKGPWGASMAMIAKADLANGSRELRGEGTRPKVKFIAEWELPGDSTLTVAPGLYRGTDTTGARYTGVLAGARLAHGWNARWSNFVEVAAPHVRGGNDSHAVATLDLGTVYSATDTLALAIAYSAGVTDHSADQGLTLAISRHW